jgi:hypothetical protein
MNDLLSECMSDLKTKDVAAFTETFCARCRQQGCGRAKWSGDKFGSRVANQVDRLFHSEQADPTSSRYEHLQDFKNLFTEAMRLEISDQRGDWSVPDVPDFDKVHMPKHMVYTNADGVDEGGDVSPPPDPKQRGPWIPQKEWLKQQMPVDELHATPVIHPQEPQGVPATVVPPPKVGAAQVKTGNTSVPAGGILLDGPAGPPKPVYDPWAVPVPVKGTTVVQPGATIKMGGSDETK